MQYKYAVIKLTASGEVLYYRQSENALTLDYLRSEIDCDYIEICRVPLKPYYSLRLVIDEEGKLKNKPLNRLASALYGMAPYDYIVGDALVVTTLSDDAQPDIFAMPIGMANDVQRLLYSL